MVDLLPPAPLIQSSPFTWLSFVVSLLILLGVGVWLLRHLKHDPVRRIRIQLEAGQLSPREAAHQLAKLKPSKQIDQIRFQHEEPDIQTLKQLLKSGAVHD